MSFEFEESSLYREVTKIIQSPSKPVHFSWFAKIHVGKITYFPLKVLSIDFSRNYENNYADEIIVTMSISGGTYAIDIYPFKDQIEITLTRSPLHEVATSDNEEAGIQSERYTATILDTGNPAVEGNHGAISSRDALNKTSIFEISFQLVNKSLEQMRLINIGGIYRNVLAVDVIKTVMTNEMKKIKVPANRLPKGIDIVPGTNPNKREHVIIPHGTKLVNLPAYIHHKCGGIYSSGFGYYLQGDHWYIYPCYDTSRYSKSKRKMTIINVPPNKFPSIERTYRNDGSNLTIMATGEVKFRDDSEVQQLNAGNGVRFADANNFMGGFSTAKGNKATISRGENNTEVISIPRVNGFNNAPLSDNSINANPYEEYSKLARRQGSIITLIWENSLPELITPGMMVKLLYLNNGNVKEVYGVLLAAHDYTQMKGVGITDSRYVNRTALSIFTKMIKT